MAASNGRSKRQRGEIETLPSGSLCVKVYAGVDPISGKRHYLTEVIPVGRTAAKEAEKARTRLLARVAPTQRSVASSPYQRIAADLRKQITAGRLRPGDQLPAVADLASAHGVSVGTAHRAVALLTA